MVTVVMVLGGVVQPAPDAFRRVNATPIVSVSGGSNPLPRVSNPLPWVGEITWRDDSGEMFQPLGLILDRSHRRLVGFNPNASKVYLADVDSLEPLGSVPRGARVAIETAALDEQRGLLLLGNDTAINSAARERSLLPAIEIVDLDDGGAPKIFEFPRQSGPPTQPHVHRGRVSALTYYAPEDRVYAVTTNESVVSFHPDAAVPASVSLHALDAAKLVSADPTVRAGALLWSYEVPACFNVRANVRHQGFVGRSRAGFVYFFCMADTTSRGSPAGVVRVNLHPSEGAVDTSRFSTEYFPIAAALGDSGFATGDPAGDRVLVAGLASGEKKLFVFDAAHRSWTGSVPLVDSSNVHSGGVDPASGRVYVVQENVGVLITEGAALPVPQGAEFPLVDKKGLEANTIGKSHVMFDPETGRMFGVDHTAGLVSVHVYEDRVPPPEDAGTVGHPDNQTSDVSEGPGVGVTYSGEASAYGARTDSIGGVRATPLGGFLDVLFENIPSLPRPSDGNRSGFFGRVERVSLRGNEAGANVVDAAATRLETDEATEADLGNLPPPPEGATEPLEGADCSSARPDRPQEVERSGVRVSCQAPEERAEGSAVTDQEFTPSPVRVASASAHVTVSRDGERGLVARAEATARGITLALPGLGAIHIEEVSNVAEAAAHGTPSTARSTYAPSVNGLRVISAEGEELFNCQQCDPSQAALGIERLHPTRIRAAATSRDDDPLVAGSPQGAFSAVIEDPHSFWSDFNTSDDARKEVAALRVVLYHDGESSSREVFEFASVLSATTYTVNPLPDPLPFAAADDADAFGGVEISLSDDGDPPEPLSAAVFGLHVDGGDGVLGPEDVALASCTTDATGFCGFAGVQLGAYIVHERSAPPGFKPADDVAFELTTPGQVASIAVVNGREDSPKPLIKAGRVGDRGGAQPISQLRPPPRSPSVLNRLLGVPADVLGFLLRNPAQALLFALLWVLAGTPGWLALRRRHLLATKEMM